MLYEIKALQNINNHKNVMKFIDYGQKQYFKHKTGKVKENINVFVFELV